MVGKFITSYNLGLPWLIVSKYEQVNFFLSFVFGFEMSTQIVVTVTMNNLNPFSTEVFLFLYHHGRAVGLLFLLRPIHLLFCFVLFFTCEIIIFLRFSYHIISCCTIFSYFLLLCVQYVFLCIVFWITHLTFMLFHSYSFLDLAFLLGL